MATQEAVASLQEDQKDQKDQERTESSNVLDTSEANCHNCKRMIAACQLRIPDRRLLRWHQDCLRCRAYQSLSRDAAQGKVVQGQAIDFSEVKANADKNHEPNFELKVATTAWLTAFVSDWIRIMGDADVFVPDEVARQLNEDAVELVRELMYPSGAGRDLPIDAREEAARALLLLRESTTPRATGSVSSHRRRGTLEKTVRFTSEPPDIRSVTPNVRSTETPEENFSEAVILEPRIYRE
ncbi:MAG: hypothetical protein Q9162_005902 [Coniocarpon cinnabarinum]